MYEGGIRTPMIVCWPGNVPAGRTSDAVWYFADVLPTLAEVAGIRPSQNIDGVSVLPSLVGKRQNLDERFLYWEFFERGFQQAVRRRNYKAVRLAPGEPLELYNLKNDAGENHNIAGEHPDVIAKIEAYLKTARTESANWPVE
jgi:arylsulfatase A-like enzyme